MTKTVFISEDTYLRIMKRAMENDGEVIIDARGFKPFAVKIDPAFAKINWETAVKESSKELGVEYGRAAELIDRYLINR